MQRIRLFGQVQRFMDTKLQITGQPLEQNGARAKRKARTRAFELCVDKTRRNIKQMADEPKAAPSAVDGNYFAHNEGFYDIGNWTSSFFSGMALLAWRETEDEYFLKQVQRLAPHYREKVFTRHMDTHHDLGFLASLYSVALYKLTGDAEHRNVGLRAAEVLSHRFNHKCGFIRAWGHLNTTDHNNVAIIDCLMNLALLYWAASTGGEGKLREIAVRHADMALSHFIRPDDTVCHAFQFDLESGQPIGEDNYCGYSKNSYWARGASWSIYGFALGYSYTNDKKYLDASVRLARKFVRHLDDEMVPVWDLRLPPEVPALRDSSAAAVAVCGFQELERHQAAVPEVSRAKTDLLDRLCCDDYLNFDETCCGVLKDGQFGIGEAVNGYTSWGDYFLMEALSRELFQAAPWW